MLGLPTSLILCAYSPLLPPNWNVVDELALGSVHFAYFVHLGHVASTQFDGCQHNYSVASVLEAASFALCKSSDTLRDLRSRICTECSAEFLSPFVTP